MSEGAQDAVGHTDTFIIEHPELNRRSESAVLFAFDVEGVPGHMAEGTTGVTASPRFDAMLSTAAS